MCCDAVRSLQDQVESSLSMAMFFSSVDASSSDLDQALQLRNRWPQLAT